MGQSSQGQQSTQQSGVTVTGGGGKPTKEQTRSGSYSTGGAKPHNATGGRHLPELSIPKTSKDPPPPAPREIRIEERTRVQDRLSTPANGVGLGHARARVKQRLKEMPDEGGKNAGKRTIQDRLGPLKPNSSADKEVEKPSKRHKRTTSPPDQAATRGEVCKGQSSAAKRRKRKDRATVWDRLSMEEIERRAAEPPEAPAAPFRLEIPAQPRPADNSPPPHRPSVLARLAREYMDRDSAPLAVFEGLEHLTPQPQGTRTAHRSLQVASPGEKEPNLTPFGQEDEVDYGDGSDGDEH
jgi:hypothetical protein